MSSPLTQRSSEALDRLLTQLLEPLRLDGVYCSRWIARAPWGVRGEPEDLALIHYVREGSLVIEMDQREPTTLRAGELALFPHGTVHTLADTAGGRTQALAALLPARSPGRFEELSVGGHGPVTTFVCGALSYDLMAAAPLYRALPPVLTLSRGSVEDEPLLASMLRHLVDDDTASGPGGRMAMLRAFETVFVLALRTAMTDPHVQGEPLAGLRDHRIATALVAMHARYTEPWTVASLARHVHMSRSTFASTFHATVGESPMSYLTHRRMQEGRRLLAATRAPIATVAREVGYGTAAGFHLAFTRTAGMTPGRFRSSVALDGASPRDDDRSPSAAELPEPGTTKPPTTCVGQGLPAEPPVGIEPTT